MVRNSDNAARPGSGAPPQETPEQKAAREAAEAQAREGAGGSGNQDGQSQETPDQKAAREAAEAQAGKAKGRATVVVLRHTTPYQTYRRAGITMGKAAAEYAVSAEQLAVLKADPNVEIVKK